MSNVILPTNPADRKKILDEMQEISNAYTRIEGESNFVKDAIDSLSKTYSLPKPMLNKLSKVLHKGNFDEEAGKFEDFSDLYDTLINAARNRSAATGDQVDASDEELNDDADYE